MFYRQDVVEMSEVKATVLFWWGFWWGKDGWCVVKSQLAAFVGPSGRKEIMLLGTETDRKNETVGEGRCCFICIYVMYICKVMLAAQFIESSFTMDNLCI